MPSDGLKAVTPEGGQGAADVRTRRLLAWGGVMLAVAVLGLVVAAVWASYRQAVEERRERAVFLARTLERSVTRTLEALELSLSGVVESARGETGEDVLARRVADTLRFAPHLRQIVVVALPGTPEDGGRVEVLADSRPVRGAADEMTPDLLSLDLLGHGAEGALSLGLRVGRVVDGRYLPRVGEAVGSAGTANSNRAVLPVALEAGRDPAGRALKVVAALNPDYFISQFRDDGLGRHGSAYLVRFDGVPLVGVGDALVPPLPHSLGREEGDAVLVDRPAAGRRDGGDVTAFHLSSRHPLAVVVTLSHQDTRDDWLAANRAVLVGLATAALVILAVLALLGREVGRRIVLQRQVQLLFRAIEQSPAVVVITDARRRIAYVNPAFTRLFGYTREEALDADPTMLNSGRTPPEVFADLWQTLRTQPSWRGEFVNRARDGTLRTVTTTISRVEDASGSLTHYIGVMDDISRRKALEAEREGMIAALSRSAEEMARLSEVTAHHFQEPVRRLGSYAQLLRRSLRSGEDGVLIGSADTENALGVIQSESGRLRDLVRDVQVYLAAGQPRGSVAAVDPGDVVGRIVEQRAAALRAAGLSVIVEGPLPAVLIDRPRLSDVFSVLIDNALHHGIPADGTAGHVTVSARRDGDRVRFTVDDTGPGIPPAYRDRVFGLFERLTRRGADPAAAGGQGGTGIGLSIVRRVVEACGGKAAVDGAPGGGTRISFDLPAAPDAAPADASADLRSERAMPEA